jgi:predicted nucleotidyltransferase
MKASRHTFPEWGAARVTPEILGDIKAALEKAFGGRLKGVVLFGSTARGDDTPDSDIDLMLVLDGKPSLWDDLRIAGESSYPFRIRLGRPLSFIPVSAAWYAQEDAPLLKKVRAEGVVL